MLEMKEREIIKERLELKSRWNRSLAVTQLPNEILFHIFVDVSEQPTSSSEDFLKNGEPFPAFGLAKRG